MPADEARGWAVRHLPTMTIVHHAAKAGVKPRLVAQDALTRRIYATSTSPRSTAGCTSPRSYSATSSVQRDRAAMHPPPAPGASPRARPPRPCWQDSRDLRTVTRRR